ncbi:CopY/TcrY family copper transport repressor [Lacticaseibacillus sp. GG6-2]
MATVEMSPAEWEVMRVVWTKGSAGTNEIIAVMQAKRDWAESTVKTLLRRLVGKKALATVKAGRQFVYHPLISEQVAMTQTTDELFDHLCEMKQGAVLIGLLQRTTLSQKDIQTMQQVLAEKAKTAPVQVACNCLAGECTCEKEEAQ